MATNDNISMAELVSLVMDFMNTYGTNGCSLENRYKCFALKRDATAKTAAVLMETLAEMLVRAQKEGRYYPDAVWRTLIIQFLEKTGHTAVVLLYLAERKRWMPWHAEFLSKHPEVQSLMARIDMI
jgi:hypothetical protein